MTDPVCPGLYVNGVRIMRPEGCWTEGLHDFCKSIPQENRGIIVEIGGWRGESAKIFASYFKKVITVDPWIGLDNVFAEYLKETAPFDNISYMKMKGSEACVHFEDHSLDGVYVDAVHTLVAVREDFKNWIHKVKEEGTFGGHDYKKDTGVQRAVDEAVKLRGWKGISLFSDTSWKAIRK